MPGWLEKKPAVCDGPSLGRNAAIVATIASLGHLDPAGCGYSHTAPRQPAVNWGRAKEKPRPGNRALVYRAPVRFGEGGALVIGTCPTTRKGGPTHAIAHGRAATV